MQCTILKWLLGIWLVETVLARHIQDGDNSENLQSRFGRDQFHRRQPFYNHPQSPLLNYNSFRSSFRRTPPQAPGRRNLVEQETSNDPHSTNNHYNNYFTNDHYPHHQNQQNLNVYSAVRLHGALEARARTESGSDTLLPVTSHEPQFNNYFYSQDVSSGKLADPQWRRENQDDHVSGESFERSGEDKARFSLYNSYFDNEHSIKALNSMKCVTPTGSPGFCATFRGCVPSFFTAEGELEAPALAELISTSIGYCTTNITHHFIREQRQHVHFSSSREERRFNSVANRIICCPGEAPVKDPNTDPDKIFNDYLESQKTSTTTTTTTTTASPISSSTVASEVSDNVIDGTSDDNSVLPAEESTSEGSDQGRPSPPLPEDGAVNDGQAGTDQDGSQSVNDSPPENVQQQPVELDPVVDHTSNAPIEGDESSTSSDSHIVGVTEGNPGVTTLQPDNMVHSENNPVIDDSLPPQNDEAVSSSSAAPPSNPPSELENGIEPEEIATSSASPQSEIATEQSDSASQQQPSPENPNTNQPNPVHPPGEQVDQQNQAAPPALGDVVMGSKPIVIVTSPGMNDMPPMPPMPHFPSDFPPMSSEENPIPPVDDSSLELQKEKYRPSIPQTPDSLGSSPVPSTIIPSSQSTELPQTESSSSISETDEQSEGLEATTASNMSHLPDQEDEKSQITTTPSSQDENVASDGTQSDADSSSGSNITQQDESDASVITTTQSQPPQPVNQEVTPSGESGSTTTNEPLSDDTAGESDAVTIIAIQENAPDSDKSGSSTQNPEPSAAAAEGIAATEIPNSPAVQQQQQQQQGAEGVSVSSSDSPQDIEVTTLKQMPSSQEAIETTTTQVQVTTVAAGEEDEDSEESSEEVRATPSGSDDSGPSETTTAPETNENNELVIPTTAAPIIEGHDETNQDEEIAAPTTTITSGSSQQPVTVDSTTDSIPPVQQDQSNDEGNNMSIHQPGGDSESQVMYPTEMSPAMLPSEGDIVHSSMSPNEYPPSGMLPEGQDEQEPIGSQHDVPEQVSETMQPFPESSPATTGESQSDPEQQHLLPETESSGGQSSYDPSVTQPSTDSDHQQPISGSASEQQSEQQPLPGGSNTPVSIDASETTSSGSEQPFPDIGASTPSESSQAANGGGSAGVLTTVSPISDGVEQDDDEGETQPSGDAAPTVQPGSGQPSGDDARPESGSESPFVPNPGSESDGSGGEPSGVSGSETLPAGSEPSGQGSESSNAGTESPVSGSDSGDASEPSYPEPSSDGTGADIPGIESLVSSPTADPDGVSSTTSQSSSSDQNEETSSRPIGDGGIQSEPEIEHQPPISISHDEPTSSADDSQSVNEGLPVSSSTASPTTTTGGPGPVETESISQDSPAELPSDAPADASPVQGSAPESNDSISSDQMQNSQSGVPASDLPETVSSPAPIISSSYEPEPTNQPSTAATVVPSNPPLDEEPDYQILKACKFQTYFRSLNDMDYSYRHYPWLATIVGGTRPFSSGTLITDRHILTASHFLSNITVSDVFNMRIHIGYRTSYTGATEGPYAVRKVRKVIRHKGFSFERLYNDIAVLVLDRPVRFSEDIYPVCISSNRSAYADGTAQAFETGWIEDPRTYTISKHHNYIDPHIQKYFSFGYKNITWRLQEADQKVRTNSECQSNYAFLQKNGILVTDSMVCAGSGDSSSCAFRGNSGAPLFMRSEDSRMTEQIGIVSWGIGCYLDSVFTRVESFLPWLDRVVYNSR